MLWPCLVLVACALRAVDGDDDFDPVLVVTKSGALRGEVYTLPSGQQVTRFLGIPYAEPPIGENRFRAPQTVRPWSGIKDAVDFGPMCIQPPKQRIWATVRARGKIIMRERKLENYAMDENCLNLNVYLPLSNHSESNKLPVLVFIHGGSYYMNGGRLYPGEKLATLGVIVVTFNYRLGPFGFLSTEDMSSPGNYGLMDQTEALKWIRDNIVFFGGDAEKVVLFGNSAGGASVVLHMMSPLSKGLFSTAVAMSGCTSAPWAIQKKPRQHAEALAAKLGCPTDPSPDIVDCIRSFTPDSIMKNAEVEDGLGVAFAPVVDGEYGGKFLPKKPEEILQEGSFNHVPFVSGVTRDEVSIWFIKFGPSIDVKIMKMFLEKDVHELLKTTGLPPLNTAALTHATVAFYLYKRDIGLDNKERGDTVAVSDFISDVGLKAPCVREMDIIARKNTAPSFFYEFNYYSVDDVKTGRQEWIGAYHESDLQFFFGEPFLNYSNHLRAVNDKNMSQISMKLWTNLAKYGHPTPPSENPLQVVWRPYTEMHHSYLSLGQRPRMAENYLTDRMLFWNSYAELFSKYPFHHRQNTTCPEERGFHTSWIFWLLLTTNLILITVLSVILFHRIAVSRQHHMPLRSPAAVSDTVDD